MIDPEFAVVVHELDEDELIENLTFEYWGIRAANPDWHKTLEEWLASKGIEVEDA